MERHLRAAADVQERLREARRKLDELRHERAAVEIKSAADRQLIAELQENHRYTTIAINDAEHELQRVYGEADALEHGALDSGGRMLHESRGTARKDVVAKAKAERELLRKEDAHIEESRLRLDAILQRKAGAHNVQHVLVEKKRQNEQDRGLMLTAIEQERGKLTALRAKRISMWQERSDLELELFKIAREKWLLEQSDVRQEVAAAMAMRKPDIGVQANYRKRDSSPVRSTAAGPLDGKGIRRESQPPHVVPGSVPLAAGWHEPPGAQFAPGSPSKTQSAAAASAPQAPPGSGESLDRYGFKEALSPQRWREPLHPVTEAAHAR
eukprot:TRINITY_DN8789_c0_g1_i2.p1 TRINITY_DN8789_c0_g1~~TRINITY_DN8789_c0_g1_i2.p1  ORF type:complete len:326 (+),score=58.74 TRINITY_DN8789_c0_g1_i2:205-1182(+)